MIIIGLTIYHSYRFSPTWGKELYKGMDLPTNCTDTYGIYALKE